MCREAAHAAEAAAIEGGPTVLPTNAWQARRARALLDGGGARTERGQRRMAPLPALHFQVPSVAASRLLLAHLAQGA